MIIKYGSHTHSNEAWFRLRKRVIYDKLGVGRGFTFYWDTRGVLLANSRSELTNKINQLEEAYGQNGKDLIFYDDDGQTLTAHSLISSNSFGGSRVIDISYPGRLHSAWGAGKEYTDARTFTITVAADFLIRGGITEFRENVMTIGSGGPKEIWQGSLTGAPKLYRLQRLTTVRLVQSGTIVGDSDHPPAPPPVAPVASLHQERSFVIRYSPQIVPGGQRNFRVNWRYEFESAPIALSATGLPFSPYMNPTNTNSIANWPVLPQWR